MTYPEADRIRDARNAAILRQNAQLRAEVTFLTGLTMSREQVENALRLLPEDSHADYLRRRELGVGNDL